MKEEKMPPVHPGEILLEDFMKPMGISQRGSFVSRATTAGADRVAQSPSVGPFQD